MRWSAQLTRSSGLDVTAGPGKQWATSTEICLSPPYWGVLKTSWMYFLAYRTQAFKCPRRLQRLCQQSYSHIVSIYKVWVTLWVLLMTTVLHPSRMKIHKHLNLSLVEGEWKQLRGCYLYFNIQKRSLKEQDNWIFTWTNPGYNEICTLSTLCHNKSTMMK